MWSFFGFWHVFIHNSVFSGNSNNKIKPETLFVTNSCQNWQKMAFSECGNFLFSTNFPFKSCIEVSLDITSLRGDHLNWNHQFSAFNFWQAENVKNVNNSYSSQLSTIVPSKLQLDVWQQGFNQQLLNKKMSIFSSRRIWDSTKAAKMLITVTNLCIQVHIFAYSLAWLHRSKLLNDSVLLKMVKKNQKIKSFFAALDS